jgi:error-prone DNA polymerase
MTARDLEEIENGEHVSHCGIVTLCQQPETAKGTIFLTLEDEMGVVQVIVWKSLGDVQRRKLLGARLMSCSACDSARVRT